MMKWLRKHRYTIFLVTIGGFVIGSFMGFGSYFFSQSPYDAALTVNGEKISYKRYQARFRQYLQNRRDSKQPLTEEDIKNLRREVLQDLVRETVFCQEADKFGLEVTDNELAATLQNVPAFQRDGRFDPNLYLQVVQGILRVTPDEFEEDRRREVKIQKLQNLLASSVHVSPLEFQWEYQKRMAAATKQEKKTLSEKPNEFRDELRREQAGHVLQEWLGQVNSRLKVKAYLDRWEGKEG